jgi:hypothetical protein
MHGGDDLYEEMVRFYLDALAGALIEKGAERLAGNDQRSSISGTSGNPATDDRQKL